MSSVVIDNTLIIAVTTIIETLFSYNPSSSTDETKTVSHVLVRKNFPTALTTVFTPPVSCGIPCYVPYDLVLWEVALLGGACSYSGNDHRDCEPADTSGIAFPYYSPGICPQGYTMACSPVLEILFPSEVTAQVCCPTYGTPFINLL